MPGLADLFRAAIGSTRSDTVDALRGAAAIADTFDAFSGDAAQEMLFDVLLPWASLVARSAVRKWGTRKRLCRFEHGGVSCRTKPIGHCHACGRPVCLAHAFVGADATLVCWPCMKIGAMNAKPWAGEPEEHAFDSEPAVADPDRLQWAYVVLGVSEDASDDEVRAAYKKMSRKNHPDKASDASEAEVLTEKLKMINVAKQLIWKARGL